MKKIVKARLIVMDNNNLLVLKRNFPKLRYSLVGGFIKKNETVKEGLIREVKEEVNAEIQKKHLTLIYAHTYFKNNTRISKKYFILNKINGYDFSLNEKHKFDEVCWVNVIEAISHMGLKEKNIIETHLLDV